MRLSVVSAAACCLILATCMYTLPVGASSAEMAVSLGGGAETGAMLPCASDDVICRGKLLTSGDNHKDGGNPGNHGGFGRTEAEKAYQKNLEHIPVGKHDDQFKPNGHNQGDGKGGVGRYFAEKAYQANLKHIPVEGKPMHGVKING